MTNEDTPFQVNESYAQFQVPGHPYSVIRLPLTVDWVPFAVDVAKALAAALDAAFPQAEPAPAPRQQNGTAPPQRPQQQAQGGPQTRAQKFARVPGECDECGGPVGRYPRTGGMRSDKAVCLGKCKDGQYVHTVFWLDGEPEPEYNEPDAIPF